MLRRIGAGVIALAVLVGPSPAQAKIELKCYEGAAAVAQLKSELKAEDQQPVLVGNRTGGVWNVNLFTSDRRGVGYNIEGNQRYGSGIESTTLCVKGKYRALVLNDVSKTGIPLWALVGGDPAIAGPAAKRAGYGAGVHDVTIRTGERNGLRVAMGAISFVPTTDGGERDGPLVIVDFSPADPKHGGGMSVTDAIGVRRVLFNMIDMQYAPRGVELLNR